jgi:hypothetical protein
VCILAEVRKKYTTNYKNCHKSITYFNGGLLTCICGDDDAGGSCSNLWVPLGEDAARDILTRAAVAGAGPA